MHADVMLNLMI